MSFTLKLIRRGERIYPDDRHILGGQDIEQIDAFNHLFPDRAFIFENIDQLYFMARIHNWKVEIQDNK